VKSNPATLPIVAAHCARPLRWRSQAAFDAAEARLLDALEPWAAGWGLSVRITRVGAAHERSELAPPSHASRLPGGVRVWSCAGDPTAALHAALFGAPAWAPTNRPTLAFEVAAEALRDLFDTLSDAASPGECGGDGAEGRGSGALRVGWTIVGETAGASFGLQVGTEVADRWCELGATRAAAKVDPRPPRVALPEALATLPMRLAVTLAPVQLTLGSLSSVQVGDVLPLPHALDEPLAVALAGEPGGAPRTLCLAHLGKHGRRKAAQLIACSRATGVDENALFSR
jgi:hypothetical protein